MVLSFSCSPVSYSALFGCFQTLPGNFSSKKPPKSWKSAHLRTLSQHYKTTQAATIRCTSINFEHFLFRSATSYLQLVSYSALLGYFWTLSDITDSEAYWRYPETGRKFPLLNTFSPLSSCFYCHKDVPGLFPLIRAGHQRQSFLTTYAIYPCFKQRQRFCLRYISLQILQTLKS